MQMNLSFFRGKKNNQQVAQPPPAPPQPQQGPTTGPLAPGHQGPTPQAYKGSDLNLVNYSPEELVAQVDKSLSRVQFGWTWITHFMENYSELWAMMGPVILL